MLDYRMLTFLKLCETMNYREAAEHLHITQPAVTQHIHYLEKAYGCQLFSYNGRTLTKTHAAVLLERYCRSALYEQHAVQTAMTTLSVRRDFRIGATKTIGDFLIPEQIARLLRSGRYNLSVLVDNTEHLLHLLEHNQLDLALIEGFFDKSAYGHQLFRRERFVGICCKGHPFARKSVFFQQLQDETLILRESGSGSRAVLEQILHEENFSLDSFPYTCCISSIQITRQMVAAGLGVSFVYEAAGDSPDLETFTLRGADITREMNYVYLKGTSGSHWIDAFAQADSLSPDGGEITSETLHDDTCPTV